MSYGTIKSRLDTGDLIVLDGGTGTEIQKRGAPMSGEVWCAMATRNHPQVVREVHDAYIAAGADVITANTYATCPLILAAHGMVDEMEDLDRLALTIALEAQADAPRSVCVAGSMSSMCPIIPGTDRPDPKWVVSENEARDLFRRKAEGLKSAGAELIIMEMMRDADYSVWATEAATASGLPVWIGIACRERQDGVLTGYNRESCPANEVIDLMAAVQPDAITIMHSSINDTDKGIEQLKERWDGPWGAYPESGYFTIPDWVFGELGPQEFAAKGMAWRSEGAQIIGGCCGVSPEHIEAFANAARAAGATAAEGHANE